MTRRYFLEDPPQGDRAQLSGDEARHLAQVMRVQVGQHVVLFDGSGVEYRARVADIQRRAVRLEIESRDEVDRELSFPLVLGVAVAKSDRQKWLVEKCVELGVSRLTPLLTRRGVALPKTVPQRWRRAVIEASKQCGRNRLMAIAEPQPLDDFLQSAPGDATRWLAHTSAAAAALPTDPPPAAGAWLAVGPEGGFADEEVAAARQAGWQLVSLGPRTLRVETAALALAAVLAAAGSQEKPPGT